MDEDKKEGTDAANDAPPEEISEIEKCRKERDEYLAGWQRARADFLNYKKEEMQRLAEIAKYQTEDMVKEFIGVLDNFDLALAALSESKKAPTSGEAGAGVPTPKAVGTEKGIYMIRAQMEDALRKRGLTRIPVGPGDKFDPALQEAISEEESDEPPGTVAEEMKAGYKLFDKVIRPARVKISKGPMRSDKSELHPNAPNN